MHNHSPLVINWHLTEACNYRCQYCYATWNKPNRSRELFQSSERTLKLLRELYRFFHPGNRSNPVANRLEWSSVRLNLAGGEPLLYASKLPAVVHHARDIGFEVSMISNGSYLTGDLLDQLAPELTWLGISIDSAHTPTNLTIGRTDRRGQVLDLEALAIDLHRVRQYNPGLRLKLNTVVNSANHNEDFSSLIRQLAPEKWKALRMLPVVNQSLAISDLEFSTFIDRHRAFASILCPEDNQDMRDSYLMIDPHGRFFQNSSHMSGQGYAYSKPILDIGIEAAFSQIDFDPMRFTARYIPTVMEA